jgi:hypothetical protein
MLTGNPKLIQLVARHPDGRYNCSSSYRGKTTFATPIALFHAIYTLVHARYWPPHVFKPTEFSP